MRNRSKEIMPAELWDMSAAKNNLTEPPYTLHVYDVSTLHFHKEMEIGLCISGSGVFYLEDREYPFCAGDVQFVYPYAKHMHKNNEEDAATWIWVFIDPEELLYSLGVTEYGKIETDLYKAASINGIVNKGDFPETARFIENFAKTASAGFKSIERKALCFYEILISLFEEAADKPIEQKLSSPRIFEIVPALQQILFDIKNGESASVEYLAEICHLSVSGFRRIFGEVMGLSPKEYINICRVREAKRLLRKTNESILNIALTVGYKDISGFNRTFLEIACETPSAYRKRHKK